MTYHNTECFWCKKGIIQRKDVIKRQLMKYGHNCCKYCFGKEKSFSEAQKARIDNRSHPHSEKTKKFLSEIKKGKPSWNKGLTSETSDSIRIGAQRVAITKKGRYRGSNNPNWKGGVSLIKKPFPESRQLKKWMVFRNQQLKNDFYQCYKCSSRLFSNQLQIHHLLSQTKFPDQIFEEQNCITFCIKCHREFHKKYGIKRFTPQNAIEFINSDRSDNLFKLC